MFRLYNSLTGKKEPFATLKPKQVSLYVCGITPYDTTHLGHAFVYIFFDVLVRVLKYKGYKVTYTQNVTDINDRDKDILQRAKEQKISWSKLGGYWTRKFLGDMKALNWSMPDNYLYASKNIDSMVILIGKLLKDGYAYKKNNSIYFDISKKIDFGKLSKFSKSQMFQSAKDFAEDLKNPDKKNPLDITLWKASAKNEPAHIPSFPSPYGLGRPGWHIECSAMAMSTLGEQIDIHGGGIDLIFPHHEAEIAQSEGATGKIPFVKFWMHAAQVFFQGKKMSKSLGNLIMISNLLKDYSPNVIRWYLISHHYRIPWEFREKDLKMSDWEFKSISKSLKTKKNIREIDNKKAMDEFEKALDNDLDIPLALKIIKNFPDRQILSVLGFSKF